ncbi:MAG: hypothetical protein K1563_12380 [Candidatus Thiodiazotropha sp. (ex. Lucinisca nassula)]|nr:hypothetical protein [Candidatus Thiodiazotropha sp. (ex. Lucinisca nassula)]MBW9274475.1 hypothetical protein [Candidatus Thiodiazotropha sp. (ex. Lucinisca nassula)]PUB87701.1 MAG: hypothetical protein DBP02_00750 [gamma proteobacterium symbiont of Ctena orbiculata]
MEIKVINKKALENYLTEMSSGDNREDILACDGGCSCDTGSDWVNDICPNEWVVGWKKSTC